MHKVHVVAAQPGDAYLLTSALQQTWCADGGFVLHVSTPQQLLDGPWAPGDRAFLLMPPLSASNATTGNDPAQTVMQTLRNALVAQGLPFQVLYGSGPGLQASARAALGSWYPWALTQQAQRKAQPAQDGATRWHWSCEKCSDPRCELRLFKGLLG